MLVQTPISAQSNTNQEAAEKIVNSIDESFPNAAVDVFYKGGQVWLKGEAGTQEQRKKIVEHVFRVSGVRVDEVNDEMQISAPKAEAKVPVPEMNPVVPAAKPVTMAVTAPVPMPKTGTAAPVVAKQMPPAQQPQMQQARSFGGAVMAPYPYAQYQAAYGMAPGQQSAVPAPYTPTNYSMPPQAAQQQPVPQYGHKHQPAYYGPPAQAAHHPEAYGPQGPLPGQYNQPNLPNYAWPAYANYPNYAQVSYPKMYSPKAWPYIGPFYPYPQVPLGWRKVTLEHHNGWWCLDFDDGSSSGPFSGLFRQPTQYTY
jgi:hypothetical protein